MAASSDLEMSLRAYRQSEGVDVIPVQDLAPVAGRPLGRNAEAHRRPGEPIRIRVAEGG